MAAKKRVNLPDFADNSIVKLAKQDAITSLTASVYVFELKKVAGQPPR
jgi:hypothetical protein